MRLIFYFLANLKSRFQESISFLLNVFSSASLLYLVSNMQLYRIHYAKTYITHKMNTVVKYSIKLIL